MTIRMELQFPNLAAKFQAAQDKIRSEVVVAMQFNRGMLFDSEGSYNGHTAWAPLVMRAGQILSNRGVLKKSLAPGTSNGTAGEGGYVKNTGDVITIGTDVASASLMNWGTTRMPGGVLRPVRAKALMIPLPAGAKATPAAKTLRKSRGSKTIKNPRTERDERVIFRKWVKIPARRFDNITPQDEREIRDALEAAMKEALNG